LSKKQGTIHFNYNRQQQQQQLQHPSRVSLSLSLYYYHIHNYHKKTMEPTTVTINNLQINGFIPNSTKTTTTDGKDSQTSPSVSNFLNIPYARIPARWHQAIPIDPRHETGTINATHYGPRCPQPVDVLHHVAVKYLYPRLATFDRQSEFECLNLNIYAPANVVAEATASSEGRREWKKGSPVLVWIHGGALLYGDGGRESGIYSFRSFISFYSTMNCGSRAQRELYLIRSISSSEITDGNFLVQRSISLGKPLIVVSLNYRLGYFGFLASKELREEARARGEVGYNNLGLHDQRVALQWVRIIPYRTVNCDVCGRFY
jgi:hypothetical protein